MIEFHLLQFIESSQEPVTIDEMLEYLKEKGMNEDREGILKCLDQLVTMKKW